MDPRPQIEGTPYWVPVAYELHYSVPALLMSKLVTTLLELLEFTDVYAFDYYSQASSSDDHHVNSTRTFPATNHISN